MNMNYGGRGGKCLHDTEMTGDCLRQGEAYLYKQTNNDGDISWSLEKPLIVEGIILETFDCKLKVGNVQSMMFHSEEKIPVPPFNDLTPPLNDMPLLDKKGKQKKTKAGISKVKEGYPNKAKGVAQGLWEQRLWIEMRFRLDGEHPEYPDMCACTLFSSSEDFR